MADVVIHQITADRFDDLAEVFGTRGAPSWCWCQYFLTTGSDYTMSAERNRGALRSQVASSKAPVGLVAYAATESHGDAAGQAVGWVQIGPRTTFPRITANRDMKRLVDDLDDDLHDDSVWAVTCFVVKVGQRRRGIGGALLDAAVAAARDAGARAVVGHPVDVAARNTRVGGSELYHGAASTFERSGFRVVGRTGATRPVMRLDL
ncbi:GNAT family N-acetyltransferase [Terrabacter sp. MAHUQ-38]|uniref:GNAT family N-acetyltransferase n=1 Tax=unclassified Terrabacter TaxID=2630222 RepID=UPI00165EA940|nr:GNAT family N-acetyltransferase [Terrabacter sp. MAHUQ-38]